MAPASGIRWYEKLGFTMDERRRYYFKVDMLLKYGTDLTEQAVMGELDPVIGREKEIQRLAEVVSKRRKRNACLIGDPGVGKTAIVEGLAINIAQKKPPLELWDKKIFSIDMARLVAGASVLGKFEERLTRLLDEVRYSYGTVILFIDEMHTLFADAADVGRGVGFPDPAAILKPALARGDIMCIGATTAEEYTKHMDKDAALRRRFVPIQVTEPSRDDSIKILKELRDKYESHHRVYYHVKALEAAVDLSTFYMTDRFLPDKAIDLLDEAGARASLEHSTLCLVSHVEHAVAIATGTPLSSVSAAESQRLLQLELTLKSSLIGQDEAVAAVSRAIRRARAGTRDDTKPVGCFLFTGPTGVGKTEMAKILAAHYLGSEQALLRLDMSEYTDPHQVTRLIGSPPGYRDHDRGGQLTEFMRRRPHALVLMDEIEKADRRVLDLLLQILDDGRLTDGKGNTVDFRHSIIILTSNIKSQESLTATFKEELLNRFDQVVVFKPLEKEHIAAILKILLKKFRARVKEKKKIKVASIGPRLMERLILEGYSETYGARMLKRAITKHVEDYLADQILIGNVIQGDTILLDCCPRGKGTTWLQRPDHKTGSDSPRWMRGRAVEEEATPDQSSQVKETTGKAVSPTQTSQVKN